MWIAGGRNETPVQTAYSYDGVIWNRVDASISTVGNSRTLAWNGYMWVVGGNGGIGYSYDGITWYASANGSSIFTVYCYSVAWNGSLWVAGGQGSGLVGNQLAYSYDGITWTASANGNSVFTSTCLTVTWNGSLWIAGGGYSSNNKISTSLDGITWTGQGSNIFTSGGCYGIASSKPNLAHSVSVGANNNVGATIVDGKVLINTNNSNSLQIVTDSYYQTGYDNIGISITNTYT
jgi:hypothetical protein